MWWRVSCPISWDLFGETPKPKLQKPLIKEGTETLKSCMHYFHLRVWEWEVINLELLLIRIHHLIQYIGSFCNKVLIIKSESFLQTFTNHKGKTINPPSVLPPSLWWMSISPLREEGYSQVLPNEIDGFRLIFVRYTVMPYQQLSALFQAIFHIFDTNLPNMDQNLICWKNCTP